MFDHSELQQKTERAFARVHSIHDGPNGAADEQACRDCAAAVNELAPAASYFGFTGIPVKPREGMGTREAMAILGALLEHIRTRQSGATSENTDAPTPMPVTSSMMTVKETAVYLGNVGDQTVYDLCNAGLLQHARIGKARGTIRVSREDADRYLEDAKQRGNVSQNLRNL